MIMGKHIAHDWLMAVPLMLLAGAPVPAWAGDPPPTIDWLEIEELLGGAGEHEVGEELCRFPIRSAVRGVL